MSKFEIDQPVEQSTGMMWMERGSNAVLGVMLLVAVFMIGLGACQFSFGDRPDAAIVGLDSMSNGILAAIVGIAGYVAFFGIGYLLANLSTQFGGPKPA